MSEFESKAQIVRRLLPLLDVRDLAVVADDVAELVRPWHPAVSAILHDGAILLYQAVGGTCNPPVAPAEQGYSCEDVEPCS